MPPQPPTGQPAPTVPIVPVVGQSEDIFKKPGMRKTAMDLRREALEKIAQNKNPIFRRIQYKTIQKGALATFNYLTWKHDPYPLILCSSIYTDGRVAGINLHYLTFRYIKYLIEQYCGKAFSYQLIKNNTYIANAFRTYKRDGLRMPKLLDCEFLMTLLGTVRSLRPNEIEAIREEIQKQLRAKLNPSADDLEAATKEYVSTIVPDPRDPRYNSISDYNPLEGYGQPDWPNVKLSGPKPTLDHGSRNPKDILPPE